MKWKLGDWGPCSSSCDIGDQIQSVQCVSVDPRGQSVPVEDAQCIQLYGQKPEYRRSCNENVPCPYWTAMEWSSCNKACGMGEQTRSVLCISIDNRRLAESACDPTKKPTPTRPCMVKQCPEGPLENCRNSLFGCCPDGRTPARGLNLDGCEVTCKGTRYGCCPDQRTTARGPNGEGCGSDCSRSRYGCCPNSQNPAKGPNGEGCSTPCSRYRYGCCPDNVTVARGPNGEGCPTSCSDSQYGCCADGKTEKRGPNNEGCSNDCLRYPYGCCSDNITPARGPNGEGCPSSCRDSRYGCCPDGRSEARGPNGQGCSIDCSRYRFGCCPDNVTAARGPDGEGCPNSCSKSKYGCCPDGKTEARGPDGEGCSPDCSRRQFGCCSDNITPARGPNKEGCPSECSASQFGCCPDAKTEARGPNGEGCQPDCSRYRYGCCSDNVTPARGPNAEGCPVNCTLSQYGCCPDRVTEAQGFNSEGCPSECQNSRYGCCSDGSTEARGPNGEGCPFDCSRYPYGCCPDKSIPARGPNGEGCPNSCVNGKYGCCPDGRTEARGPNGQGCSIDCSRYRFGCCPDKVTPARGPDGEGCPNSCRNSTYGCCPDGRTKARGPNREGCTIDCSRYQYGCCPDNVTPARGPNKEGCPSNCTVSQFGCCPDQVTEAKGYNMEGCPSACLRSRFGCCPDGKREARGPNAEGCSVSCEETRFGCCPDNQTPARGPGGEGCNTECSRYPYGCCSDQVTPARGPNGEGCLRNCAESQYGCCSDGRTEAKGPNQEGCLTDCARYRYGCCSDNITPARGPNKEGCPSNCTLSIYGCCPDQVNEAQGYNYEGCPPECMQSRYGCCQDNKTRARGPNGEGCSNDCSRYRFGCCSDNITPARGPDGEGCPNSCSTSRYGCCEDGQTESRGPNREGCPTNCSITQYGCCLDGKTAASGPDGEGCFNECSRTKYGCCSDNQTPAQGPNEEGCAVECSRYRFGCCPNSQNPARGPNGEGCSIHCSRYRHGCCADNVTIARGPNGEGCQFDCSRSEFGCCEDGRTTARGPNRAGCLNECARTKYGCCSDQKTPARGPRQEGCPAKCRNSIFGCCSDGVTEARGPNGEGCESDCERRTYGCCADNKTPARGPNGEGCPSVCELSRYGCCPNSNISATGPNFSGCPYTCYSSLYGCCSDNYTAARGPNKEGCPTTSCKLSIFGCCPNSNISASGPNYSGCPYTCYNSLYGCCSDNYTAARGSNGEGCPSPCDEYPYGCCQDGRTPAKGPRNEGCPTTDTISDFCGLKPERGPCRNYTVLHFYNSTSRRCERFWYGGCEGNDNRFKTKEDCEAKCSGNTQERPPVTARQTCENSYYKCCPDGVTFARGPNYEGCQQTEAGTSSSDCQQPSDSGRNCEEAKLVIKWYYNRDTARCDRFWFRGCGGNGNNFETEDECRQKCRGGSRPVTRQPVTRQPVVTRAPTTRAPVSGPICELDHDTGPCREYKVRWYYNRTEGRCLQFWYGGCQGNGNRFETQRECDNTCRRGPVTYPTERPPVTPSAADPCQLPPVVGRCRARLQRWYYNAQNKECQLFTYGGCGGNANNFRNRMECFNRCMPKDMIRNLHVEESTSDRIIVAWEPPQNNDVQSYTLAYMGTKYYRDTTKQDPMKEVILTPETKNYTMHDLMDGADYMINMYPEFNNGRGSGPKSSIMAKTRTLVLCDDSIYGCCPDGITAASGKNYEGCDSDPCKNSRFGCCEDGVSEATGPNFEGCDLDGRPSGDFCNETVYGCCPDGETPAQGANHYGCPKEPEVTPVGVCRMKNDHGTCTDYVVKWFYNSTASRCDRFWYGGCGGNDNRFDDEESCSRRCGQTGPDTGSKPVCEQPRVTGPCRAYFKRYYFNGRECEEFVYGGCQGNDNNFETQEQCESTCEIDIDNTKGEETCQQSMDTGPCRGNIPRWYYDTPSKQCLEFNYGGCQGNTNNFETREECQKSCASDSGSGGEDQDVCRMTSDSGPCRSSIPRWFYDYNLGICKEFIYGGCNGNQNNFETQQECESSCSRQHVCKPFETGQIQCLAYHRRYKYDPSKGDCEQFIYGGCRGNSNNFATLESCRRKCAPEVLLQTTTESSIEGSGNLEEEYCHLPMEKGKCRALIPAWYYDHLTGLCNQFEYGGCDGNDNRFTSREVCESSCSRDNVCNLDTEVGNCLALIPRYTYNKVTGTCESFSYGGCGGNANNFDSLEACNRKCGQTVPSCSNQEFQCGNGQCVSIRQRCDGIPDCTDRSDEDSSLCGSRSCPEGYFRCSDGTCVAGARCDGRQDCRDNSDESSCEPSRSCPEGYFRCSDGTCVAGGRCDGRQDCRDNSDENQCGLSASPTDVDVSPSRGDSFTVLLRWRAPATTGLNPIVDYLISYTNKEPNSDSSQWYTQQVDGGREYAYVTGLQPDSTYYFKIQARNRIGYGPYSGTVIYVAPSRTTVAPRNKDPKCLLPVDRGSCSNMTVMYYYDPSISDCRPFRWYGCTGNANRFSTGQECREACWDRYNVIPTERPRVTTRRPTYPTERPRFTTRRPTYPTERPRVTTQRPTTTREYTLNVDLCDETSDRGTCSKWEVKWYFNKTEGECRQFWYGGCDGNANRFDDERECREVCINRQRPTPAPTKAPDDKDNEIDDRNCGSRFGCCPDGITPARDFYFSNCNDEAGPDTDVIEGDYTSLIEVPDSDVVIPCNKYRSGYGTISWYKDGFQITKSDRLVVNLDGSLLIHMATLDDSGMYACRVAEIGSTPEIERFRLQVEARGVAAPITIFPTPAMIVVQPGADAFLHCQAYGNPQPRVAWSRDGYDVSRDPRFTVYRNGTLIIQRTIEQDMGSYLCVASNGVSTPEQRIVKLQLRESLRARIDRSEETKREGEALYLTCSGIGYPTPTISWRKNGLPLTTDQRIKIQGGSMRIINLALEDTGTYTCVVRNDEETVEDTVSIQVVPFDLVPSTCVDTANKIKCSLIVSARLCGHTRYSKPCCESCQRAREKLMRQSGKRRK
ncbi:papilin-like [Saccostrea cucullata]|uniref:papilin-like n=1 Tax=Saccostrea cuccullata TaxID=36930 RepID=UPI002ED0FD86